MQMVFSGQELVRFFTMGGHNWIIENNIVRQINSLGIEVGFQIYESRDKRYTKRTDPDIGYNIIRNNRISECGGAGIRGLGVTNALVEKNYPLLTADGRI